MSARPPRIPCSRTNSCIADCKPLFVLQNTIHWIKSITVADRGARRRLSVGHFKPINSKRYLTDCHEYVFHLTKTGNVPLDRLAVGVRIRGQKQHRPLGAHTGEAPTTAAAATTGSSPTRPS